VQARCQKLAVGTQGKYCAQRTQFLEGVKFQLYCEQFFRAKFDLMK